MIRRYEKLCEVPIIKLNEFGKFNFFTEEPECFVSVRSGHIVKITDINLSTGCIFGQIFKELSEMFTIPLKSSRLGMFIVKDLSINIKQYKISDIKNKIMILDVENELIAVPLYR